MSRTIGSKNSTFNLSSVVFSDEAIPAAVVSVKVNPFSALMVPIAAAFLTDPNAAQSAHGFDVPADAVPRVIRYLGSAAKDSGVALRKSTTVGGTDQVHVSFWLAALKHDKVVAVTPTGDLVVEDVATV